jgi:hypothetical protein
VIDHAMRFTVSATQRAFIHPATHFASDNTDPSVPPMGLRFRMKASYDCGGFSAEIQVICTALKKYGMFVADNGSDWYITGAPDSRWSDDRLGDLKTISGDAFEVVATDGSAPPATPPPPAAPIAVDTPVPAEPTPEITASLSPRPSAAPTPTLKGERTPTSTPVLLKDDAASSGGGLSALAIGLMSSGVLAVGTGAAGGGYYWYRLRRRVQ